MARTDDVVIESEQCRRHADGLLAAASVDAAKHFTLAIQFALDAVFHLPLQLHVVKQGFDGLTLAGLFRALLGLLHLPLSCQSTRISYSELPCPRRTAPRS